VNVACRPPRKTVSELRPDTCLALRHLGEQTGFVFNLPLLRVPPATVTKSPLPQRCASEGRCHKCWSASCHELFIVVELSPRRNASLRTSNPADLLQPRFFPPSLLERPCAFRESRAVALGKHILAPGLHGFHSESRGAYRQPESRRTGRSAARNSLAFSRATSRRPRSVRRIHCG